MRNEGKLDENKDDRSSQAAVEIWINACCTPNWDLCDPICRYFVAGWIIFSGGNFTEVGNCVRSFVCRDSAYPRFIGECLLELPFKQHEDNALTKDTLTSAHTQNTHIIGVDTSVKDGTCGFSRFGLIMLWTWLYPNLVSTATSGVTREQVMLVDLGPPHISALERQALKQSQDNRPATCSDDDKWSHENMTRS
jgi:hypothetical protein